MYLAAYSLTLGVLAVAAENAKTHGHVEINNLRLPHADRATMTTKAKPIYNITTFIDKTENLVRMPDLQKTYEEQKAKRKNLKKSPKRTIQKIIKKNRSKKRLYMNQATMIPPRPSTADELDKFYAQEEMLQKNENMTTIQVNQKKKRKWNVSRYPMPFQHMVSSKGSHKRNKRGEDTDDRFILTDLDEVEFIKSDKDSNVINAHMKKYW